MHQAMKRLHIYIGFIFWLLVSLFTMSCNDELAGDPIAPNSPSNLHVLVPTINSAKGNDQSDNLSNNHTYNATVDECQINDLRLYAFPIDGKGSLIAQNLPAPLASMMLNENIANYQLTIEPGKYHIYVVANMSKILEKQNITSEESLKNQVLRYTTSTLPGLPIATNIPMIYEPEKDAEGNPAVTIILPAGEKYTEVAANLKFTCVKVKLNIIFDPTVATSFGTRGLTIKSILGEKLSPFTSLYWGNKFVESAQTDNTYKTGFESTEYDDSNTDNNTDAQGMYYTDWTDNRTADNSKDDIIGSGNGTKSPVNSASKWLFQGTYYLPERYITQASDRSYLQINGQVGGSVDNNYHIDLGHRNNEQNDSEVPTFPRGTFYEITGDIKTFGNMSLDCNVSVKDWEPVQIDADFNHTTLWVSKTTAKVTSTTTDSINYESNAIITKEDFGCDTKVNNQEVVVLTELDIAKKQIKFSVNKNIKYTEYNGVYTGTAKVWLKAGNIKKYIDVTYNVAPYFDITPQEVVIYWGSDNNQKVVNFKTNLEGLEFKDSKTTSTIGNSTILAACANPTTDDGTFTITATTDPITTTEHLLYVQPKEHGIDNYNNFVKAVKVIVKPAVGNYRINFRAINDRIPYAGANDPTKSSATGNFLGVLDEGGNNNWNDGWFEEKWTGDKYQPQTGNHCIYVYTQIGETVGEDITGKGWIYTEKWGGKDDTGWPGDNMVADNTNTGWYYKDFSVNAVQKHTQHGATGDRKIKPGETLIMFSNNYNNTVGYSVHRCPQHLEPGIPLFDYEDCEGWIVYDPTSDPVWHMYDDKPEIDNIHINVYTKFQTYGWFKVYGVAKEKSNSTNEREQFTIYDNNSNHKSWSCTNLGNGWWKTVITLKAIRGEHEKDIRIKSDNKDTGGGSILLFNGNSFKDDTGYYDDNDKWHQGKPSGVTQ